MAKSELRVALIKPDGSVVEIHNSPSRVVDNITGLGFSDRSFSTVRGVFQNGNTLLSQRLEDRQIGMTILYPGCSWDTFIAHRNILIELFRENNSSLSAPELYTLVFQYLYNRQIITRYIDVYLNEGPAMNPPRPGSWDHFSLTDEIILTAPYPIWYDPTSKSSSAISWSDELVLPHAFPFILGSVEGSTTITYGGNWEAYPTITLVGPITNVSIIHDATDLRINYEGVIPSGTTVTIDLKEKTAVTNWGNDVIQNVSGDIGTWAIQPNPPVANNLIYVYADSTSGVSPSTQVTFTYYNQYRGI